MSHDALFQLGMGSVLLNASQTEDIFAVRALKLRAMLNCIGSQAYRFGLTAMAIASLFRAERKSRSNSAKRLMLPAAAAIAPSRS